MQFTGELILLAPTASGDRISTVDRYAIPSMRGAPVKLEGDVADKK